MTVIKHYTESLYYELLLTMKYLKMHATQVFEQECIELTPDEMASLDVIACHSDICQRDLAKLILKDRANTGRILDSLEERGFIERNLVERNNRAIKQIAITPCGQKYLADVTVALRERFEDVQGVVSKDDIEVIFTSLKKIREAVGNIVKTQI